MLVTIPEFEAHEMIDYIDAIEDALMKARRLSETLDPKDAKMLSNMLDSLEEWPFKD